MLKRFILWDYPRGSRPYDVIVGIILAFIFLTPRDAFRDQPRILKASQIAQVSCENGNCSFFVEAAYVKEIPENQRVGKLTQLLQTRTGVKRLTVSRVEPILDSEGELLGYVAFARL